ncbi:hypothetical protein Hypma_008204 [Hypsizygus marmoreus]|uniref:Uncharacterized protein n=1 Tax=Hypsizygus marmoreus TaxID=39966 RepID=A0A369JS88_HYPMA|nr:hypothetical protein Hypma_008204 [Hypsizygus marmoreus]
MALVDRAGLVSKAHVQDNVRSDTILGRFAGVEVHNEAGGCGFDTPVVLLVGVELVEPDDDGPNALGKLTYIAGGGHLSLGPRVVVHGTDRTVLELAVVGEDLESIAAGHVEDGEQGRN